jgi:hypothetical protein
MVSSTGSNPEDEYADDEYADYDAEDREQPSAPGHSGAGGADAHSEDCCIGEPVGQGQAGHRHPA